MKDIKLIQILTTYLLFGILNQCEDNQLILIQKDGASSCETCPDNCQKCLQTLNQKILCNLCEDNYYHHSDGKCYPCYKKCLACNGPELNQCQETIYGYYFKGENPLEIKKCST